MKSYSSQSQGVRAIASTRVAAIATAATQNTARSRRPRRAPGAISHMPAGPYHTTPARRPRAPGAIGSTVTSASGAPRSACYMARHAETLREPGKHLYPQSLDDVERDQDAVRLRRDRFRQGRAQATGAPGAATVRPGAGARRRRIQDVRVARD